MHGAELADEASAQVERPEPYPAEVAGDHQAADGRTGRSGLWTDRSVGDVIRYTLS